MIITLDFLPQDVPQVKTRTSRDLAEDETAVSQLNVVLSSKAIHKLCIKCKYKLYKHSINGVRMCVTYWCDLEISGEMTAIIQAALTVQHTLTLRKVMSGHFAD